MSKKHEELCLLCGRYERRGQPCGSQVVETDVWIDGRAAVFEVSDSVAVVTRLVERVTGHRPCHFSRLPQTTSV